jgi:hypothetical protein
MQEDTTSDPVIADVRNFHKVELWTPTIISSACCPRGHASIQRATSLLGMLYVNQRHI